MYAMRVISLGWGVQSFALAAMSALDLLPPVDAAIHADTMHERSETYEFAAKQTPWLEERGVQIVTVKQNEFTQAAFLADQVFIPAYTNYPNGKQSGMLRRSCTDRWKIQPIRRWLQAHRDGAPVEQWLGITLDEIGRMKPSDVKYITNRYPFIEMFDPPMSRWQVVQWLNENGLGIPVKSSCVFCPYHDRSTWRGIKMHANGDWARACAVDDAIRNQRPNYVMYIHRDRIPLREVDVRNEADHGQLSLWDEECEGYCFL